MPARGRHPGSSPHVEPDRRFDAEIGVSWDHRVRMTSAAFDPANATLVDVLEPPEHRPHRAIVVVDDGVARAWPDLDRRILEYGDAHESRLQIVGEPVIIPGGETAKNDWSVFQTVVKAIDDARICRRSYVIVIGGGAVLDVAGFASAVAHRGVRLIRLPTTTLSQGDSGIGVKNGINAGPSGGGGRGCKKNFLGAFSPPWAVISDESFLATLSDRDWRSGFSEAVKVGLVKDAAFFQQIERCADKLVRRVETEAIPVIRRSAELHLDHIVSGGDPFELTAARPLDFGHWAAHKLESMTNYRLTHGEAVAIGMAIDTHYSTLTGRLDPADAERILACLAALGFTLDHDELANADELFDGIEEFREHLGGRLTIPMLAGIGAQVDVHEIDLDLMRRAIDRLTAARAPSSAA